MAIFIGLGFARNAQAQTASFYDDGVTLYQQQASSNSTNAVSYSGTAFDAPYVNYIPLGTTSSTNRPNPNLGTYDLTGTSQLVFGSGSLVADPPTNRGKALGTLTGARIRYRVYPSATASGSEPAYSTLTLTDQGAFSAGGEQFGNTTNVNLLSGLTVGGTYVVDFVFDVDTKLANGSTITTSDPSSSYQANFTLVAPPAPTLTGTSVYISPNNSGNIVYHVTPPTPPAFQGADLGTPAGGGTPQQFNVNNGILILNGGVATTTDAGGSTVQNVTLYYRVYQQGTTPTSQFNYINLPLTSTSTSVQNGYTVNTRTFSTASANINLINNLPAAGTYNLDVYYLASGNNTSTPTPTTFQLTDNNNGSYYTAHFTVNGTPTPSTIWTGGINDNWFDARNWTNGVPNSGTNATIANLGTNNPNPYPNIYSNTTYQYGGATVDNSNSGPAEARNLIMSGNTQSDRSILRLQVGRLNVYGDFDNRFSSFIQRETTIIGFVGANQSITGGDFQQVVIDGSGTKSLTGTMNVAVTLTFNNGLLVTDITNPGSSVVNLADRSVVNNNNGATLVGEREGSYLRGFAQTTRASTTLEEQYEYGFMGMYITWHAVSYTASDGTSNSGGNPGSVQVTRNTAEAYNPVQNTAGIRRIFGVRPGNPNATTGGLNGDIVFQYLTSETKNLGSGGNININKANLVLFISKNSGNTFTNLGRTANDTINNKLTKNGVTSFATFTLGDQTHPLPVRLVAFDAKRINSNALITWATATETNSSGFEVQVATDGKTYRKIGFVASFSANSGQYQAYSYTDTEANKSGVRYYRLRQVDLDGTESFSPVRVVSFSSAVAEGVAALSIYPNPSTGGDQATVVVQSSVAGAGTMQLLDMTGRSISTTPITTVAGITEVAVPQANSLSSGIYMVKVTFATGEVKTIRLQKR
ncbi:T9SS type A sorting domain-containing protein [Hymenobacter sp. BRD67]|uniref:T9SS type A sorting domain-containing protein n=1 Tax=Hymenobacter sp. BRD67 TaxID=2675877 RepID=UPI0015663F3C|nr:T9SS type A sorting domain-containing protein [Hymenobacter sp. BRD67]QKG53779.1 T9SS type A sorting domain-containing protein [Hymenobacter sp. BRD67]